MEDPKIKLGPNDFFIGAGNPEALDATLNQLGAALLQSIDGSYTTSNGRHVVRCLASPAFIKFACKQQGYGEEVDQREVE